MSRSKRPLVRQYWRLALAAVLACGAMPAHAGAQRTQEQDCEARAAVARALVILKIAPYITAANGPAEPPPGTKARRYRVGVVGSDAVAAATLRELPGKKVDNATVTV